MYRSTYDGLTNVVPYQQTLADAYIRTVYYTLVKALLIKGISEFTF